jgi:Dyp-type peroxidase family
VLRQLAQDVSAFWTHLQRIADRSGNGYGDATALAARMVGRWPDGAPLVLAPNHDDPALSGANDFAYHATDQLGLRCPIGAHLRRAHPRDSLDPNPGSSTSVAIDRRHRLLRRGRLYGPRLDRDAALAGGDDRERGLHFMCLCASVSRQFEFIQHTWVNNPRFDGLYEDADPLIGPSGRAFTIQARPARRRLTDLPAFVRVRGGGYFFLPGIRALRWLGSL